jgi:hypothetical protein
MKTIKEVENDVLGMEITESTAEKKIISAFKGYKYYGETEAYVKKSANGDWDYEASINEAGAPSLFIRAENGVITDTCVDYPCDYEENKEGADIGELANNLKNFIDKKYTGDETQLLYFDNDIINQDGMQETDSIFGYSLYEMLNPSPYWDGFGYMVNSDEGVNVYFSNIKVDNKIIDFENKEDVAFLENADVDDIYVTISKTETF